MTLRILTSRRLERAGFAHGFSTRQGGVSEAPFEALDFAILRDPDKLRENQRRLGEVVGFDPAKLFQTRQVHGRELVIGEGEPSRVIEREADALAGEPGTRAAVCVRVADCVPVLVADPASGRVAAVHAGWRGTVAGVLERAVAHLREGAGAGAVSGFVAAIGPCIGACCFEVGDDVASEIASATSPDVIVRREPERGKAWIDLRFGVRAQLTRLGVEAIDDVPGQGREACTKCNPSDFYSYRRDGDRSGRLVAVIVAR